MTTALADAPATPRARSKAPPVHACTVCAVLPERPADPALVAPEIEYRPRTPRPAPHGGPRSRRCTTHQRAHKRARRLRVATVRRTKVYGLDADTQAALVAFQRDTCPCGKSLTKRQTDHDHAAAAEHDHPDDQGCPDCVRGFLCWSCNREIVGRFETFHGSAAGAAAALRRLADYLDDPPLARLRRGEVDPYLSECAS